VSVAAGTRGNVVRLGDPKDNEYVVVRLGRDEVPFAPSELSLSTRSKSTVVAPPPPAKPAPPAPRPRRKAPTPVPRRATPPLTVTLRFRGDEWTVEAQRGSRRVSRPGPLRPGAVSAFAEHVDDDVIRDALVETVDSCRAVVEQRAAALRAELQEAEAALRAYESKPTTRR
jgi:hypothetical protein